MSKGLKGSSNKIYNSFTDSNINIQMLGEYYLNHIFHAVVEALITVYLIMGFIGFTPLFPPKTGLNQAQYITFPLPASFVGISLYIGALIISFNKVLKECDHTLYINHDDLHKKIKKCSIKMHVLGTFLYTCVSIAICLVFGVSFPDAWKLVALGTILGGLWNYASYCCDMRTNWILVLNKKVFDDYAKKFYFFIKQILAIIFAFLISTGIAYWITHCMVSDTMSNNQDLADSAYALLFVSIVLFYIQYLVKRYLVTESNLFPSFTMLLTSKNRIHNS